MDPNHEIDNIDDISADTESDESVSVDDFIKQLEEKEKDLHITADTTIIEISQDFEDGELPDFLMQDFQIETVQPIANAAAPAKAKRGKSDTAALESEIASLKQRIVQAEADRDELLKASLRRTKDFENFKFRTERERKDTFQNQVGNLATQMLPALDNLNRAIDFAFEMPEEQRAEIQQFFDGIVLVNQQVNEVLAEMGLQPIATVGEVFDPHFHEAVATEESAEFAPNTVSAELLRGYRLGDRVIRHSMVKVAKAVRSEDSPEPDTQPDDEADQISDTPDTPNEESES